MNEKEIKKITSVLGNSEVVISLGSIVLTVK